ncbi:hypothetical protein HID58_095951 [Brassica napus]|uniref:E2F transcription factor CC-MB domain-containing protein n=1 Tax=Brassica napus TaxID=3708 RepID=A0ABQ7X218_BRANA|nr:hypothetical protein HID58_095951 [Brassica napus]
MVWGVDASGPGDEDADVSDVQAKLKTFPRGASARYQISTLFQQRNGAKLRDLSERKRIRSISPWLFVTEEDIKSLPGFQNQTLIAVKAPHGTTLEVPDPDEVSGWPPQGDTQDHSQKYNGSYDVYLLVNLRRSLKTQKGPAEPPPPLCLPIASCSGSTETTIDRSLNADTHRTPLRIRLSSSTVLSLPASTCSPGETSDLNYLEEQVVECLRLLPLTSKSPETLHDSRVPFDVHDGYWKTDSGIDWDYGIADVSTPPPMIGDISPTAIDSIPR